MILIANVGLPSIPAYRWLLAAAQVRFYTAAAMAHLLGQRRAVLLMRVPHDVPPRVGDGRRVCVFRDAPAAGDVGTRHGADCDYVGGEEAGGWQGWAEGGSCSANPNLQPNLQPVPISSWSPICDLTRRLCRRYGGVLAVELTVAVA